MVLRWFWLANHGKPWQTMANHYIYCLFDFSLNLSFWLMVQVHWELGQIYTVLKGFVPSWGRGSSNCSENGVWDCEAQRRRGLTNITISCLLYTCMAFCPGCFEASPRELYKIAARHGAWVPLDGCAVPLEPWVMVVFIHLDIDLPSFRDDSGLSIVLLRSLLMGLHPVSKHGRSITWTVKSQTIVSTTWNMLHPGKIFCTAMPALCEKTMLLLAQSLWLVDQLRLKIWHGTLPSRKQLASLELLRAQYWSLAERTHQPKATYSDITNQPNHAILEKSGDRCLTRHQVLKSAEGWWVLWVAFLQSSESSAQVTWTKWATTRLV